MMQLVVRTLASMAALCGLAAHAQDIPPADAWRPLFNGRDLDDWTVKIRGYPTGVNHADTFRVENGVIAVAYDGYDSFDDRFGHLFYDTPFSHYRLRLEYRFVGQQARGAPVWALRNSGVMLHAQPPETMTREQDFPISVEVQLLGGLGNGEPRSTGNMCSPGTHVAFAGELTQTHCIESRSVTFDGDQWVRAEVLVLGSERIVHYINDAEVMDYGGIVYGGGVVSGHRPELKPDGRALGSGYIALQSEGHPVQFRRIGLLDLVGCMDESARNYAAYFVAHDPTRCRYGN